MHRQAATSEATLRRRALACCAVWTAVLVTGPVVAQKHAHSAAQHEPTAALGVPGDPARATRTIDVRMSDDMRFTPARIEVRRGDTVRFHVTNAGALEHEMVLGDAAALARHAREMRAAAQQAPADHAGEAHAHGSGHAAMHGDAMSQPAHAHGHAEPGSAAVMVPPGRTADLVWRFTRSGQVQFACLVPGHFEAGMTGTIAVR